MATISYCISVCNEHEELDKILQQLSLYISDEDEIVLLVDENKVTQEVSQVIIKYTPILKNLKVIGAALNKDFATFKNNFVVNATKDFIFQIDADELLSDSILLGADPYGDLKAILDMNPTVDLYWIARENYVTGITSEYVNKWGWRIDELGRVNYDDPQPRIFRNNGNIKWTKPVHEQIIGHTQFAKLPQTYFLIHIKSLDRQIKQNEFYSTI